MQKYIKGLSSILIIILLCSCTAALPANPEDDTFSILCTDFSAYDWLRNITDGIDDIKVDYLLKNGTDIHSFQPSSADIINITNCDLLVMTGGISHNTIIEIIEKSGKNDIDCFNMMEQIEDRLLCGDEHEEHNHNHQAYTEYDEHICLSLKNAEILCQRLSEQLMTLLPDKKELLSANTENYIEKLVALDNEYMSVTSQSSKGGLVVADRFPFRYLANDYAINCYSAFHGCSSETEASFKTILELSNKVDELGLDYIITIEGSDLSVAKSVIENTATKSQKILTLNSLQSVSLDSADSDSTYLKAMSDNLNVIKTALN